jgi:hypothetical protein
MIADLFRAARRPLALSIFGTAFAISSIVFFPIAGRITQAYGWRAAFVAAVVPGAILAVAFGLTVQEPARGGSEVQKTSAADIAFSETLRFMSGARTYLLLLAGSTFMGADVYAAGTWYATLVVRVHGLKITEIASIVGPVRGILAAVGVLLGGVLTDRLGRRNPRWRLYIPGLACLMVVPADLAFLLGDRRSWWVSGFAASSLLTLLHQAPVYAAAMNVAKVRMRARDRHFAVLHESTRPDHRAVTGRLAQRSARPPLRPFCDSLLHARGRAVRRRCRVLLPVCCADPGRGYAARRRRTYAPGRCHLLAGGIAMNVTARIPEGTAGCEIKGVDLSRPLAERTLEDIMLAFEHFLVMMFRDQDLTPEQHKAITRNVGDIIELPQAPTYGNHQDMQEVRREAHEPVSVVPFTRFHTDSPFLAQPPLCMVMRALDVPRYGGDTAFANMYLAYEELSEGG